MTDYITIIQSSLAVLQAIVLAVLIIMMFFKADTGKNIILFVFYGFALNSFLLSDLFWIVYTVLRPDIRMPFAANEFGEYAFFLLFAAALAYVFRSDKRATKEAIFAVLFVAANTALWYGWSGELIQDALTGFCLGYLSYIAVNSAKHCNALKTSEWISIGVVSVLLVFMQALTFFVPERPAYIIDKCCYVLIFLGILFFIVKSVLAILYLKNDSKQSLCIVSIGLAWTIISLYMSSGIFYAIVLNFVTLFMPFTYIAVRREATNA